MRMIPDTPSVPNSKQEPLRVSRWVIGGLGILTGLFLSALTGAIAISIRQPTLQYLGAVAILLMLSLVCGNRVVQCVRFIRMRTRIFIDVKGIEVHNGPVARYSWRDVQVIRRPETAFRGPEMELVFPNGDMGLVLPGCVTHYRDVRQYLIGSRCDMEDAEKGDAEKGTGVK